MVFRFIAGQIFPALFNTVVDDARRDLWCDRHGRSGCPA
jgi:hypothetical protein